jgi:hypothetical protein
MPSIPLPRHSARAASSAARHWLLCSIALAAAIAALATPLPAADARLLVKETKLATLAPGFSASSIHVSPDGSRTFYIVIRGEQQHAVLDGKEGPAFSRVSSTPSKNGLHQAYIGTTADGSGTLFRDKLEPLSHVANFQFSPDGSHWFASIQRGGEEVHIIDGQEQPPVKELQGVTFSANSTRLYYWVRTLEGKPDIMINGRPQGLSVGDSEINLSGDGTTSARPTCPSLNRWRSWVQCS